MYKAISDYGLIGDMHSLALVSNDGSIDYCSMPHIDSSTVFASLLDDEKGGFFKIQPQGKFRHRQEYIKDTNILSCTFNNHTGKAELIDFMPIARDELFDKEEHSVHRCLKMISGKMDFSLQCVPRPHYASGLVRIERKDGVFKIISKNEVYTLIVKTDNFKVLENTRNEIIINFSLQEGEVSHFDFIYGQEYSNEVEACNLEETHKFWVDWLHNCIAGKCSFLAEYGDMINRSLLVLKLLSFQPTGAIAAAATTSLPETIGGERNWDYRFSWLRDASFTLKALFNLGHISEADNFIRWLHQVYEKYGSRNLQIMYSLQGESNISEKNLTYLKGYKNSKPVRIGNAAFKQSQWDIYGEIMDTALRLSDYAGKIDQNLWPFFRDICNLATGNWKRPDQGIWEVRNGPFHFVYSKLMCWVALDRGIKIARRYGFDGPVQNWEKERNTIKQDILEKGYDRSINSFVQRYESDELDSSLILLPLVGFLPVDDERIKGTITACKKNLMKDGLLLRYISSDGIRGEEGAFILCNFWLIEYLALFGEIDEAKKLLTVTLKTANHLGLFSEEYDFKNNQMLGNFPQGFSHIGFINAASSILNVQYKVSYDKEHITFVKRISKLIPRKLILNKTDGKYIETAEDIAVQLKVVLNNLQGAFFDAREGRVDYEAMKRSESYTKYIELARELNAFNPFSLKRDEEKKAFWINIYNILIIHGIIELDIHNSVREVFNFFTRIAYSIGGLQFSPDDIEHGILRANRPRPGRKSRQFLRFDKKRALSIAKFDPRIHFALVCASSSCPPIEFYDAANIDEQLDIAAKSFINRRGLILDRENNILNLSQVSKWFLLDFGKNKEEAIGFILKFANQDVSDYISRNKNKIKINYLPYNWNLNKILK